MLLQRGGREEMVEVQVEQADYPVFQRGMTYATWNKSRYGKSGSDESLEALTETGTEWVALVTTWYQDRFCTTDIYPTDKTPTDESIIHAIETIHELDMKVMLKPHLDLRDKTGWRGEIECSSDHEWLEWFESYREFILHYARMAQENDVEMFCIGTELTYPATTKPAYWRKMISDVREVYDGYLTYAANWNNEYQDIKFWDMLDYAGIDPYFPLTNESEPDLEEIKEGWQKWFSDIKAWQQEIDKPVLFTEIGYRSSTNAAKAPWEHKDPNFALDLQQQVDCYEALLQTFYEQDWFYGIYWWYWGTSTKMGGRNDTGFKPQNKPVEETIAEWYKKDK